AAQRLGVQIAPDRRPNIFRVLVSPEARASLPTAIAAVLPVTKTGHWFVSFVSPTPEGAEYLGRNHRFVATLAQFLMEEALTKGAAARVSRCGATRRRGEVPPGLRVSASSADACAILPPTVSHRLPFPFPARFRRPWPHQS